LLFNNSKQRELNYAEVYNINELTHVEVLEYDLNHARGGNFVHWK